MMKVSLEMAEQFYCSYDVRPYLPTDHAVLQTKCKHRAWAETLYNYFDVRIDSVNMHRVHRTE